jgi:hypothetical protein
MKTGLTIEQARTPEDREDFARFQWKVYRGDPSWVPPLLSERVAFLDPERNPFYDHADVTLFTARREGEIVGTIAALVNHRHNEYWGENTGFFGLFEVVEDQEVAEALLETASNWVRDQGMTTIRGPANFSTNEEIGLLVDGWNGPPVIMMTYNPRYYVDFIEGAGFSKAKDLLAYLVDLEPFRREGEPEQVARIAEKVKERRGLGVRNVDMRNFDEEVKRVKELYNSAWSANWGFVPLTDRELNHLATQLRQIIDPDLSYFVEKEGKPVGFIVLLPDLNQALLKAHPRPDTPEAWTMLKLLWHWKIRGSVNTARAFIGGLLEPHRGVGAGVMMVVQIGRALLRKEEYRYCEMSWILEDNLMMRRMAERYSGKVYRTYRVYQKAL